MRGSARGTALVLGAMAVPVLLVSLRNARRGSDVALLVAAGALLYVVYNAVLFLFLTPFDAASWCMWRSWDRRCGPWAI